MVEIARNSYLNAEVIRLDGGIRMPPKWDHRIEACRDRGCPGLGAVGLGTWQFGAGEWGYGTTLPPRNVAP